MALRHPLTFFGAVASVTLAVVELWREEPVLNRASVTLAWTMLPMAAAFALIAGGAVHRARGRSDAQPPMIMPLGMEQRTSGLLLGISFAGAFATFVLQLALLVWLFTRDDAASLVWNEILVGLVYVMFAAALGAAIARWISHPSSSLISILTLIGLMIAVPYRQGDWGQLIGPEWLLPMAWPQEIVPYEVAFRPAGLHLVYLGGLTLLVAATAVLGRWAAGWTLLVLGGSLAVPTGVAQLGPIAETRQSSVIEQLVGDNADLTCETQGQATYCALAGYERWIPLWIESAEPILEAAPAGTTSGIEVRQYPTVNPLTASDPFEQLDQWWFDALARDIRARPRVVAVGVVWADYAAFPLAHTLARVIAGCGVQCDGEAQTFAFLWLAAHNPGIRSIVEGNIGGDTAPIADCMVAEAWRLSSGRTLMHANWDAVIDPTTSYEEAGALLGIEVPAPVDEFGQTGDGCE